MRRDDRRARPSGGAPDLASRTVQGRQVPRRAPPKTTVVAINAWLEERIKPTEGRRALKARRADPLFVRLDGSAFSPQALDRLIVAWRSGQALSCPAAPRPTRSGTITA